ncbi:MAG: GIY-YIG nuclease family protein [Deltaproteobacteria bacterium]|nr:GIY-YIG nuclease family protein [Deltaproteobacteria bacterium]
MKPDKDWVVYLVRCSDKSLYCGITNNLKKRLDAHNLGKGAKYTRSRTPVELIGTRLTTTRSDALKLEHRIKKTPANRKLTELANGKASPKMKNARVAQDIQKELQSVVKGIQQIADSLANIVTAIGKFAQPDSSKAPEVKRAPTRKKVVVRDGVVEKIKRIPASQIVYDIIQKSANGIDTAELMKATKFDQRKIHNITFRLKKRGRITTGERGIYKKG